MRDVSTTSRLKHFSRQNGSSAPWLDVVAQAGQLNHGAVGKRYAGADEDHGVVEASYAGAKDNLGKVAVQCACNADEGQCG